MKFTSPYLTGMPDRLVLMPKGAIYFVELKTTGAKPKPHQQVRIDMLNRLGCSVEIIDDENGLQQFFKKAKEITNGIPSA